MRKHRFSKEISPEHLPSDSCVGCPFGGPRVGSKGDIKSPLVLVGESPGGNEKRTGEPFSGDSGVIVDRFLPPELNAYVLNAMECSPPRKKKNPKQVDLAAACCHNRLLSKVTAHPRRLIVAMGNAAVRSLTGDYNLKITQIRGHVIPSPLADVGILPVVHPAALMRGTGNFRQFKDDLMYGRYLAEGGDPAVYEEPTYETIFGDEIPYHVLAFLWTQKFLGADIETTGLRFKTDRILTIGITDKIGKHVYVFRPEHLGQLKRFFEDKSITWAWHNGKFDIKFLRAVGIRARVDDDTLLQSYTLDETRGVHDLETVAGDVVDAPDYKYMIKPWLPKKDSSYELVPTEVLSEYMSFDVSNTARIHQVYKPRIEEDKDLSKLYHRTLIPASEMLAQVESNGMYIDPVWLADVDIYLTEAVAAATQKVQKEAGWEINPASPVQMSDCLYKQFKLPNRFDGSTNKDAIKWFLEKEEWRLPIVHALQEYRVAAKAYGTYVKGVYRHIHIDGRVYPTYLIHGSITGRLACREPNLQNIPRDWVIRGMFAAPNGRILLEIDLSQAELRSLAALSGDPVMVAIYNEGRSLHKELALHLFGKEWAVAYSDPDHPDYTKAYEQYIRCKNVNFGIIYGVTKYGLADQIRSSLAVAQEMLDGWADRFPVAWQFIGKCRATASKGQVITTTFGRKKRVSLVTNENLRFLENEAANFPHQSIASDITLHAAMKTIEPLSHIDAQIVNLIHDAILIELPNDAERIHDAATLVKKEMEHTPIEWGIKRVPFVAEGSAGNRWGKGNMSDYHFERAA